MLTIKTYIKESLVDGIGLFATYQISKGDLVWQYHPDVDLTFSEERWAQMQKSLSPWSYDSLRNYSYKENGQYIVCLDQAQFMNHSDLNFNVGNSKDLKKMYALRDIEAGEELLCNYFDYSDEDDHHLKLIRRLC